MQSKAMKQSKDINKNDWCTPPWLFERLHEIFNFEVDGACDGFNNVLSNYHTIETTQETRMRDSIEYKIFVNPPFNEGIEKFFYSGAKLTCMLLPFRPETKKWHMYIWPIATIFVFNKRIQYIHPDTHKEVKGAAFPSCLVFFGDLKSFDLTALSDLGIFIKKYC